MLQPNRAVTIGCRPQHRDSTRLKVTYDQSLKGNEEPNRCRSISGLLLLLLLLPDLADQARTTERAPRTETQTWLRIHPWISDLRGRLHPRRLVPRSVLLSVKAVDGFNRVSSPWWKALIIYNRWILVC